MVTLKRLAMPVRSAVRAAGWDVIRFPGNRHQHLRAQLLRRLDVDLVLDVGANTGQFGRDLRSYGYARSIVSFEPMAEAYDRCASAAADDADWSVVHCAAGAEPGELVLNIAGNSISSSLLPMLDRHTVVAPKSAHVGSERVAVERLDMLAGDRVRASRAPYLKVDTQGYEAPVLDGASGVWQHLVAVELEMSLVPLYDGQRLMPEMIQRMSDDGFRLAEISPGFVDPQAGETLQVDGIFVREGAAG